MYKAVGFNRSVFLPPIKLIGLKLLSTAAVKASLLA